ncbi:MAG: hypothetical protein MJ144_01935 [Clostridia bacterium]|nr:hypothetical protein [Clostridia bacterium]
MIVVMAVLCAAAMAVILFVEGPEIITRHVSGLTLTQNGFSIDVDWEEMECEGYDMIITNRGKKTVVPEMQENHYNIENVVLDSTYKVTVYARLKSGHHSRKAVAEITPGKHQQKLKLDIRKYDGFKGDMFAIAAKGVGDVSYDSSDSKVAEVNDDGQVVLKGKGHADITVSASGDGLTAPADKTVKVNSYPDSLKKPGKVSAETISESRAVISWGGVDFATGYQVLKKNLATGNFEAVAQVKGSETSAEITRNTGTYAVRAIARVQDRTLEGNVSETIQVKGTTEDATTYSGWHNRATLRPSGMVKFRQVHGDGSTRVPQSLSVTKDCLVISFVNSGGSAGKIVSYRKTDGECIDISSCSSMGHANGTTYNPNTNRFYVVKTHKGIRTRSCSTYDGTTKELAGIFDLPRQTSGIAYDESNNKFYLSKGNEIYVCDTDFNVEKFIHKRIRYNHAQDIGAYNGIVFVCTWVSGNSSYIDMYRASDGAYLGGYDMCFGEIESCVVDDGYLYVLMNNATGAGDCILRTQERLSIK